MSLAPIGLSTYSRLLHLKQTIEALKANTLAKESDLYIFSDAAKPGDEGKVDAIRKYIDTIYGFKNIYVFKRSQNSRIRNNRDGISELIGNYGKCIFLEEDIVTAPGFLRFMNDALDVYEKDEKIFCISGYSPPIAIPSDYRSDVFILRRACAWGLGIWHDRFKKISYLDNDEVLKRLSIDREIEELSKYGEDLPNMILLDAAGKIDALDIKIFYYQFLNEKFSIYPRKSLVRNIGHDGSGVHCGRTNKFDVDLWGKLDFEISGDVKLDDKIIRSNFRFRQIRRPYEVKESQSSSIQANIARKNTLGENLIFLISQPRAGSTLLQRILNGHPDIHTTAEPWIMLHPLYALKKNGLIAEFDSNLARLGLEDFISQVPEGQKLYFKALRNMGGTLYNRALEVSGKRFFLDKTPRYHLIIPELKTVFPKAKFIFLLRNPLGVLSSTLKSWFQNDPGSLQKSPNYLDIIQGPLHLIHGIQLLKEDAVVVKYEELVEKTEDTVIAICYKLGIPYQNGMLNYGSSPKPKGRFGDSIGIIKHNNAVPDYIDKWVRNFQTRELYEFAEKYMEALGSEVFDLMGYPYHENKKKLDKSRNQANSEGKTREATACQHTIHSNENLPIKYSIAISETKLKQNPFSAKCSSENAQNRCQHLKYCNRDRNFEKTPVDSCAAGEDFSGNYLVSAIVSTFNSERFIRGRLEDLENQTISNRIEIVVVNSGSQQNEEKIIAEFQEKYSNIKYIKTNQRETVYAAWNRGIKAAQGQYITNANTDDRLRHDAFEVMVNALEANPEIALVYANVIITETENETFERCTPVGYYNWLNFNREDLMNKGCFVGPQPMWRRNVHDEYGYFDDSFITSGDYEFWLRISQSHSFMHLPLQLGLYLRSPGSIEHSNRDKQGKENQIILNMYRKARSSGQVIRRIQASSLLDPSEPRSENTKSPEAIYRNILSEMGKKQTEETIEELEKLAVIFPEFALTFNDLGVLYYNAGDKEKSLKFYKKAAQLDPENMVFQKNLADFYCLELGRIEDALNIYVGILSTHPRDIETLLATGQICAALERPDDAKAFYHRVLELEPGNVDAVNYLRALDKQPVASDLPPSESVNTVSVLADKAEPYDLERDRSAGGNRAVAVSIIISLDGIQSCVKECIKNVMAHTPDSHEMLLINCGATKGLLKWAQQLVKDNDPYRIIECRRQAGWAESLNLAVRKASGEMIVLMHNDAVVPEGWLNAFKILINLEPNIGVMGPMSNRAEGLQQRIPFDQSGRVEFESAAKTFYEQCQYRRVATRKLSDFCLVFPRELPAKIGYFDEQFVSEEVVIDDFCKRAVSGGYQNLIAADTYVYHYGRHRAKKNASARNQAQTKARKKYKEKWNGNRDLQTEAFLAVQLLERAEELSQKGQIDPAVEVLLGAIGVRPEDPRVYLGLSEILLAAKRFQDAKDALSEMPPAGESQEMRKALVLAYAEEGLENFKTARALIEQVLLINPGHAPALNLKGILAYRNGDPISAEKYFNRAIDSDPGYGEPYTNLGMLSLETDPTQDAFKFFEKAFRLSPADFDIATNYHSYIGATEDFSVAEILAREAAALYPNNQKIKYMLIDFLVQQGKYEMAMSEIEDAVIKFGTDNGIIGAALKVREKLGPIAIRKSSPKVPVSVCMIIKDEERYLARCLASVKPIVDEMIVVDTGSTDRSKDIAIAFGARVYDYEWKNDFAEARNYSISKASGEWILILDGDEVISALDHEHFNKLVQKTPRTPIAYSIITRNYNKLANIVGWMPNDGKYPEEEAAIGWLPSEKVRLFYGKDQIWFEGPVHELVDPVLKRNGIETKKCRIPVHHFGRLDKEKLDRKGEIYFDIGRKKLSAMGDDLNALRELAVQATILEKNQEAFELWQRLLDLSPTSNLAAIAYVNMGTIYNRLGKFEEALDAGKKAVKFDPDLKEARYNHAMAELHCGNALQTIRVLEALLKGFPDYPPAQFILSAAYCCADQKEKGLEGIKILSDTPMGAHLDVSCLELAQSLIAAGKMEYAVWVLGAAIESEVVNSELLALFKECVNMKAVTPKRSHITQPFQENFQEAMLENLPQ